MGNETYIENGFRAGSIVDENGDQASHITDASTSHSITDPADAPLDVDALRDDLVANTIPAIESALNSLGTTINSILVVLENIKATASS